MLGHFGHPPPGRTPAPQWQRRGVTAEVVHPNESYACDRCTHSLACWDDAVLRSGSGEAVCR